MPAGPMQFFKELDPDLLEAIDHNRTLAFTDGLISRKLKILIAMALIAANGAVDGIRALANQAIQAGASKEEIAEVLRVVLFNCGTSTIYAAGKALEDL